MVIGLKDPHDISTHELIAADSGGIFSCEFDVGHDIYFLF